MWKHNYYYHASFVTGKVSVLVLVSVNTVSEIHYHMTPNFKNEILRSWAKIPYESITLIKKGTRTLPVYVIDN